MAETESKGVSGNPGTADPKGADEIVRPAMTGIDEAPIIFFEAPAGLRVFDGTITIGLAASKVVPMSNGNAEAVATCVGYLKGTTAALLGLRKAIDDALLLGAKTEGPSN